MIEKYPKDHRGSLRSVPLQIAHPGPRRTGSRLLEDDSGRHCVLRALQNLPAGDYRPIHSEKFGFYGGILTARCAGLQNLIA